MMLIIALNMLSWSFEFYLYFWNQMMVANKRKNKIECGILPFLSGQKQKCSLEVQVMTKYVLSQPASQERPAHLEREQ